MASNSNTSHVISVSPYPKEIQKLPMFYPHLTKQQAEQLIVQHNQGQGTFLMRPNASLDPSFISISVSLSGADNQVYRLRAFIEKDSKGLFTYYLKPSDKFNSFRELLKHYRQNKIYVKQSLGDLYLLYPLNDLQRIEKEDRVCGAESENRNQVSGFTEFQKVGRKSSFLVSTEMSTELNATDFNNQNGFTKSIDPHTTQPSHEGSMMTKRCPESYPLPIKDPGAGKRKIIFFKKIRSESEGHDSKRSKSPCALQRERTQSERTQSETERDLNHRAKDFNQCRPPAPLPRLPKAECDPKFFYSEVDTNRNYFQEIYQRLKEAEICECGLRLIDSELSNDWAIHRSNDEATDGNIFFQKGEITTWDLPQELLPLLTKAKINFILFLCHEGRSPIPPTLAKFLNEKRLKRFQKKVMNSSHDSSPYVLSSSSSSSSSSKTSGKDREYLRLSDDSTHTVSSINSSMQHRSDSCHPNDLVEYEVPSSLFSQLKLTDANSTNTAHDAVKTALPSNVGQLSGMPTAPNSLSSTGYPTQVVYVPVNHTVLLNQSRQHNKIHQQQLMQHQQVYKQVQTPEQQIHQQQQQPQQQFYHHQQQPLQLHHQQQPQQTVRHQQQFQEHQRYLLSPQQFHPQQQQQRTQVMIRPQNDPHQQHPLHHLTGNQQYIQHDAVHLKTQSPIQQHMDLMKQQQLLNQNQIAQGQSVNLEHSTRSHPHDQHHTPQRVLYQMLQQNPPLITIPSNVRYSNLTPDECPNIMQNQCVQGLGPHQSQVPQLLPRDIQQQQQWQGQVLAHSVITDNLGDSTGLNHTNNPIQLHSHSEVEVNSSQRLLNANQNIRSRVQSSMVRSRTPEQQQEPDSQHQDRPTDHQMHQDSQPFGNASQMNQNLQYQQKIEAKNIEEAWQTEEKCFV